MRLGDARSFLNAGGAKRFFHRRVHSVKLMVARHLFRDRRAVIFEYEKMADQIEKSPLIKHTAEQNLKLRHGRGSNRLTGYSAPRHEAFTVRANRSDARFESV